MLQSLTEGITACKGICMNISHHQDTPVFFMMYLSYLYTKLILIRVSEQIVWYFYISVTGFGQLCLRILD